MEISNKTVWLILSKDREWIAKGTPRNRELVRLDNLKDKKRFLTYSSKGMAENGFRNSFFYQWGVPYNSSDRLTVDDLEAVEVEMILKIKSNGGL